MKLAIISTKYGNGLKKDYKIIKDCLGPIYEISYCNIESPFKLLHDEVRIFLEVIDERYLGKHNILIPNQEWFEEKWISLLPKFNLILTKSYYAKNIFAKLHGNVQYVGFTSLDLYQPAPKKFQFFHSQGKSRAKKTQLILDSWLPEYPPLICISRDYPPSKAQDNILHIDKHVKSELYTKLLNESLIALCPSDSEGFGHYINEARACKSLVMTTDAPPMNEFRNSLLFKVDHVVEQAEMLDKFWNISIDTFRQGMSRVLSLDTNVLLGIGAQNRKNFLDEKEQFVRKFVSLIKEYEIQMCGHNQRYLNR